MLPNYVTSDPLFQSWLQLAMVVNIPILRPFLASRQSLRRRTWTGKKYSHEKKSILKRFSGILPGNLTWPNKYLPFLEWCPEFLTPVIKYFRFPIFLCCLAFACPRVAAWLGEREGNSNFSIQSESQRGSPALPTAADHGTTRLRSKHSYAKKTQTNIHHSGF